jgi:hypothetical protein
MMPTMMDRRMLETPFTFSSTGSRMALSHRLLSPVVGKLMDKLQKIVPLHPAVSESVFLT